MTENHDVATTDAQDAGRHVSRRTVLKAIGIGGGAVVVAGAAGVGVRSVLNGGWDQGKGAPYDLWSSWQDAPDVIGIVAAGVLAANPHNIQPWVFVVDDGTVELFADSARTMPVNDSDGRERIAGFGCAVENMVVAARSRGLDARVTTWPSSDPAHVARVDLVRGAPATAGERALAAAIAARHTNRGPYAARSVEAALPTLTASAPSGAEVVWVTDARRAADLGALYVEATQAIVEDEEMSVEAFSWFRSNRSDVDRHRDGLTLDCQGLDAFTLFMAKILPAQSRPSGDAFWVNATRDVHTATAAAYGVIRVPDTTDPHARLAGGRLLQHVHLAATAAGLGVHHMNQVTERIARDAALSNPDRFGSRWGNAIGIPTGEGLVSFRIGYPERSANPSPRRPLDAVARAT